MTLDPGERIVHDREVVAVFGDATALENAIEALQIAGTDRAQISVMSSQDTIDAKLGHRYRRVTDLADADQAATGAEVNRYEMAEAAGAVISVPVYIGATAGLIAIFATGGGLVAALAAGLAGGSVCGGFGVMAARALGQHHADHLEAQMREGGLLLWVRVADQADEDAKIALLRAHGGNHVHGHNYERQWGEDEVPLHKAQPDPLLENEPVSR
jgi:hypothetical protein